MLSSSLLLLLWLLLPPSLLLFTFLGYSMKFSFYFTLKLRKSTAHTAFCGKTSGENAISRSHSHSRTHSLDSVFALKLSEIPSSVYHLVHASEQASK